MSATTELNGTLIDRSERQIIMDELKDRHSRIMHVFDRYRKDMSKKEKIELSKESQKLLVELKNNSRNE